MKTGIGFLLKKDEEDVKKAQPKQDAGTQNQTRPEVSLKMVDGYGQKFNPKREDMPTIYAVIKEQHPELFDPKSSVAIEGEKILEADKQKEQKRFLEGKLKQEKEICARERPLNKTVRNWAYRNLAAIRAMPREQLEIALNQLEQGAGTNPPISAESCVQLQTYIRSLLLAEKKER